MGKWAATNYEKGPLGLLHPRVLQRRLADAGTSFEELLDNYRRNLATEQGPRRIIRHLPK